MDKKQFEDLLNSMGISYTHTASRATSNSRESLGRYSTTGDWIEEEIVLNAEPDGIKIKALPNEPCVCDHCGLVVDKAPVINVTCKVNRWKTDWRVKCQDCKKILEYKDFQQSLKSGDK